ncbi:carboxypeptidase-like regulatory domain-containing protein [Sphingobacterium cellulitidis]|uniref:carboxypeptidase-like regulatory domain-containing protein n=1 Tax=Sphingobacterium cellulitidis TaxID=1768011 RepID=UPI000B9445FB|nr:TonB-dependent receptor [Sphingobacterium cellulitidis]
MQKILAIIFLFIFSLSAGFGQEAVQLRGKVVHSRTKVPLVGITINLERNKMSSSSNEEGDFVFVNLRPGMERLIIQAAGFRNFEMEFELKDSETILEDIELDVENQIDVQTVMGVIDDDVVSSEGDMSSQDIQASVILSNDIYLNKVGFKLSPYRFRVRGYDPFYEQTYINGVLANDQYRRVFNYASIGALNDLTRNGDVVNYNQTGTFSFGTIGGSENINMRASSFAKGGKVTLSYTNRNYYARSMFSYSTGLNDKGWAFTGAIGGRYSDKGYIPGTSYQNLSYAFSMEKQWANGAHSLSLLTYGSPVVRGQQGSSFQEVYDLVGDNLYNPNWGYQDGKVRNSRVVHAFDPSMVISHRWKIDEKTSLSSGGMFHYGRYSNSALNWYDAMDPRPDYYRYLPSNFSRFTPYLDVRTIAQYTDLWKSRDPKVTQLNWDEMYRQNMNVENWRKNNGAALYMVERRHSDLLEGTMSVTFNKLYDNNYTILAGVEARKSKSYQYKTVDDLMGSNHVVDLDKFAERENPGNAQVKQNDLLFPDRKVYRGDIFGYDYDIDVQSVNAWVSNGFQTRNLEVYYGTKISYTDFQRKGNMQNGRFPEHSYGYGPKYDFIDFTVKGGLTYKLDGRNFISANTAYITEPPIPDRSYVMPRVTDRVVKGLSSSRIFHSDINYVFSMPHLAGRVSVFQTNFYDQLERMNYYHDSQRTFVFHNLSGVDRKHRGIEASVTYSLNQNWNFDFIGTLAEYYYSNNPMGTLNSENGLLVNLEEQVIMKNLFVSGTPQAAGIVAARYFYNYWFFEVSGNMVGWNYMSPAALRRMASVYTTVNPYQEESYQAYQKLTHQERLPSRTTFDASIGKLVYLKNRKSLNFNLSVMNLLNSRNVGTGGFEQGRLDLKYPDKFSSRYFYMQGLNVFFNTSYRF